ncbi:MAG: shikimate kinase [Nocardioidaceae bacterium]
MTGSTSGPRLVLVGPPGAGKTSVGEVLATRWGVELHDTDRAIEAERGKPVTDVFVEDGEEVFRDLERAEVAAALTERTGLVALGGGSVLAPQTRTLLLGHRVAFLDIGLAAAAARVGLGVTRPLLLGNVRGQLKTLLDARRPLYTEVASVTVHTDDLTVEAVADEVERLLG